MTLITVKINDRIGEVEKETYVKAKTKDLQEFGYTTLTEREVMSELERVLKGEELSVIGHFIKSDLVEKDDEL